MNWLNKTKSLLQRRRKKDEGYLQIHSDASITRVLLGGKDISTELSRVEIVFNPCDLPTVRFEARVTQSDLTIADAFIRRTAHGEGMDFKMLRESRGMSQTQLAEEIGVGRSTVAMWEAGKSVPRVKLLPMIADALGVPLPKLMQTLYKEEDVIRENQSSGN